MTKAEYKSSLRSKRLIREAFLELIQTKPIEKITVTDIVRHADINRGTFYAHYQDVRAILDKIENEVIQLMMDAFDDVSNSDFFENPRTTILKYSKLLEEDMEFYRIILSCGTSQHFLHRIKRLFVEYMKNKSNLPDEILNSANFAIFANYLAGGIVNVYQSWFLGDLNCTFEDIANVLSDDIIHMKKSIDLQLLSLQKQ